LPGFFFTQSGYRDLTTTYLRRLGWLRSTILCELLEQRSPKCVGKREIKLPESLESATDHINDISFAKLNKLQASLTCRDKLGC
jgi:hypothetical protein